MLTKELALVGRDDELGHALDDVDFLLPGRVAEVERAGLALARELKHASRQHQTIERRDGVLRREHAVVPAERWTIHEASELGVARHIAERRRLTRDEGAVIDAARDEHLDEARIAERP